MAKVKKVEEISVDFLRPYGRNAKIHTQEQVEKIAESIKEFGFLSPCLIDGDYNIIAGHGRVESAKLLGLKKVPCVFVEGLTEEQRRAYILADNKLTEMGEWNLDIVQEELENLENMDFDIDVTGFDLATVDEEWFEKRKRYDNETENETEEYKDFVEKFEIKRTTDDCYTPDGIYDVVASYVEKTYGLKREKFVRPFYPNGDYQKEKYREGDVVVDNPPFSILSEIIRFYTDNDIKFFLFAPTLVGLSETQVKKATMIATNVSITYENGAKVSTSFTTNLENEYAVRTAPDLYKALSEKDKEIRKENQEISELPVYEYPPYVAHMAKLGMFAKYGIDYKIKRKDCVRIGSLDSQEKEGKAIFGGGLLMSEKAKAEMEKAKAEMEKAKKEEEEMKEKCVWQLSEREKEIIKSLG